MLYHNFSITQSLSQRFDWQFSGLSLQDITLSRKQNIYRAWRNPQSLKERDKVTAVLWTTFNQVLFDSSSFIKCDFQLLPETFTRLWQAVCPCRTWVITSMYQKTFTRNLYIFIIVTNVVQKQLPCLVRWCNNNNCRRVLSTPIDVVSRNEVSLYCSFYLRQNSIDGLIKVQSNAVIMRPI